MIPGVRSASERMTPPGARAIAVATLCSALAVAAMVTVFRGDWSGYVLPLGLLALAVFAVVLRWQTVPSLRRVGVDRVVRVLSLSCLGSIALCTGAVVVPAWLSGCPIIGDPTGQVAIVNGDGVSLVVYAHGPLVPSLRRSLEPGASFGASYLVGCGTEEGNRRTWVTIAAEYSGVWVYCREVLRRELVMRDFTLTLRRGEMSCVPEGRPAGPP